MAFKYPCSISVKNNQKAILCVTCELWTPVKCCNVSEEIFNSDESWFCRKYLFNELPNLDLCNENSDEYGKIENESVESCNPEENDTMLYNSFDSTTKILNNRASMNIHTSKTFVLCIDVSMKLDRYFSNQNYDVISFSETMPR